MSWEDVRNLESLSALEMKMAEDALDDAIGYLAECIKKLDKAGNLAEEIKNQKSDPIPDEMPRD
jgi:hypothetical protein